MIDHGGGSGVCVSASSTSNNHGDVGSSSSNSSSHRGVGGDDKHVVATAASSSSSDSQAQLPPPHHQHQGSTTHTFDRDAALVALRRLGADMDERFVEQQQLLRIAYEHLCIQIEQLRCRVPYVTMTAPAGAAAVGSLAPAGVNLADCLTPQKNNNHDSNDNNRDSNDNAFAMMTVNALLHDTQQPHSDTKRSGQRDGALLGDVTGGATTTLMGTPAAAVGSQRYRHHDSQPRDDKHNDDKDDNNNNGKGNDTLAPAGTLGSIGDSGTAAVGPLSATRSHPFLSVFDDMSTTTTTMTTMGDSEEGAVGTQSTNVRKDDVASSLAADLATAAVAAVVGDDEDDEDEQQRQRRQQQQRRNDTTTTAMTTAAAAAAAAATPPRVHGSDAYAYAVAAATLSPQTHATTDAAAPPLHPRSASGSGYAAAATHDGGSWHALSSTSPARHGNTAAATAAATDTFTASPQALSKLSIDVLSCFGQQQGNNNMLAGYATEGNSSNYPHHAMGGGGSSGGVHLSFEKLYTQLTSPTGAGVQGDSGRLTDALYNDARFASLPVPGSNSNSSVNSSNTNNNVTTATVASASAATAAAAAAMLGASPSSLPPPSHAQMTQQQQQQQQQHQVSPAARHARAHDIIPIDSLRTLHDQHLTTTIKAVYEHGRPVVVPTPGGAPVDVAALGIDVRSSCQVLVEFKRERVLQYDSVAFVAPGSYVMVGGDRGEDLGLVIYTWCEVSHKPRNHQHNNNSSGNGSGNGAADAVAYSKDSSSSSNNDGNDKVAALGDASSSGNAHVDAVATAAAVSSALPADYAHQRSAVVGIGLTGSRLRRSIGVGNGTVLRLASDADVRQLHTTQAELERRAIDVCGQRVLEHALPMVIVDAEYQYDKNKLTFFYEAQQRLDFRELVRDLFKTFRARIWMEPLEV